LKIAGIYVQLLPFVGLLANNFDDLDGQVVVKLVVEAHVAVKRLDISLLAVLVNAQIN